MKKILITILLLSLTGCSSDVNLGGAKEKNKLKTSKDRIYSSKKIDDIRCDEYGENCVNKGKVMQYTYLKDSPDSKRKIKIKKDNDLLGAISTTSVDIYADEIARDYNYVKYRLDATTTTTATEMFMGVQFVKEIETGLWYELENPATTTIEDYEEQIASTTSLIKNTLAFLGIIEVKADTSTFYPDAGTGNTTVDGFINKGNADSNWEATRDATYGSEHSDTGTTLDIRSGVDSDADDYVVMRGFFLFDTSSIGTDTVDSATLSLWAVTVFDEDNDANAYISIAKVNPNANNNLVNGDFNQIEGTDDNFPLTANQPIKELSSTQADITGISTGQYTVFTLNSDGLSNISGSGISKFGVAEGHDINDVPIDGIGVKLTRSMMRVSSADNSGTAQDPKLVVIHSAATPTAGGDGFQITEF